MKLLKNELENLKFCLIYKFFYLYIMKEMLILCIIDRLEILYDRKSNINL